MKIYRRWLRSTGAPTAVLALVLIFTTQSNVAGQVVYLSGQDVVPVFDGWEENPDGTFNLVFGYFSRNWDEELDILPGPNNHVEPGGPDQGQPTHFLPRRNRYVFRVKVPKDFGNKELVWTLTAYGKTNQTYASLKPGYITDPELQQFDVGDFGHNNKRLRANKAPKVSVEGDRHRTVKVGEPLTLTALASDDGIPKPRAAPIRLVGRHGAWGLRVAWFVYRGPGKFVTFEPEQFKVYPDYRIIGNSPWTPGWVPPPLPPDGKFPVKVTFSSPGTFVVRVMAHDGGLQSTEDVTVTVNPATDNR